MFEQQTILDFEVAIRDSFLSHFHDIEAKGCSFHFSKAIISKVSRNGFKSDYSNKDCPSFSSFIRAILGLCYVPLLRFKEGIRNLYLLAKRLTGKQRTFSVQMINYVLKTWVNGSFPPCSWVMYNHQGETTNNHSEGYNFRLGHNRSIEKHPNSYRWVETITQELRNSENEALMAKSGNANLRNKNRKTIRNIQWRREMMVELEKGNVDLLSYQQSIGGSIFNHDNATQDDVDFDEPLLERSRRKDDEEIIVPELWEIVAPLPVGEPAVPAVQSLPPLSQPAEPSVPEPAVPHTPAQAEYRQVNARKRKSDVSHSVVGAGLRKKRRRCLNEPRPLSQSVSISSRVEMEDC